MAEKKLTGAAAKAAAKKAAKLAAEAGGVSGVSGEVHERTATRSEEERLERGKSLAAHYLTQRDGLDEDLARQIIDGMAPEEVNALIVEANTAVMDDHKAAHPPAAAPASVNPAAPDPETDGKVFPDFATIPALAGFTVEHDGNKLDFRTLTEQVVSNARTKNAAEARYKAGKQVIMSAMDGSGSKFAAVDNVKLERYTGNTVPQLDPLKLLEKGVSIDIINQCWTSKEYEDVRVTYPRNK